MHTSNAKHEAYVKTFRKYECTDWYDWQLVGTGADPPNIQHVFTTIDKRWTSIWSPSGSRWECGIKTAACLHVLRLSYIWCFQQWVKTLNVVKCYPGDSNQHFCYKGCGFSFDESGVSATRCTDLCPACPKPVKVHA